MKQGARSSFDPRKGGFELPADVTPEFVWSHFEKAGRTLMAHAVRGVWPDRIRSNMPDILPQGLAAEFGIDYLLRAMVGEKRFPQPPSIDVDHMDRVSLWIELLPNKSELHGPISADDRYRNNNRRIVQLRSLINPRNDRNVCSWRRIGEMFDSDEKTVKKRWETAVALMASRLNQPGIEQLLGRAGMCSPSAAAVDPVRWERRPARISAVSTDLTPA